MGLLALSDQGRTVNFFPLLDFVVHVARYTFKITVWKARNGKADIVNINCIRQCAEWMSPLAGG